MSWCWGFRLRLPRADICHHRDHRRWYTFFKPVPFSAQRTRNLGFFLANLGIFVANFFGALLLGGLSGLSLPRGEIKNRGMNKDTKSVIRICLALELKAFCSFAFHIPLSTFTAHWAVCMSSSKLLVVFDRVCNSAFSYVIDHYLVKNNLFDMFHSRIKCRTPKFSNFDFQVSRIPVGVVGSDPLAVTLESHEILCDNVIGTGGHFPAFRPLFLA